MQFQGSRIYCLLQNDTDLLVQIYVKLFSFNVAPHVQGPDMLEGSLLIIMPHRKFT